VYEISQICNYLSINDTFTHLMIEIVINGIGKEFVFMNRSKIIFIGILSLIVLSGSLRTNAGIKRVWAVDDGEKIRREDINSPLASDVNNSVWKNKTANLFGAKNEIIEFQLILEAESEGACWVMIVIKYLKKSK